MLAVDGTEKVQRIVLSCVLCGHRLGIFRSFILSEFRYTPGMFAKSFFDSSQLQQFSPTEVQGGIEVRIQSLCIDVRISARRYVNT